LICSSYFCLSFPFSSSIFFRHLGSASRFIRFTCCLVPQYFVYPERVFYFPLRQFPSIPAVDSFNNRKHAISIKFKNTEQFLKFCSIIHKDVLISFVVIRRTETFTKLLTWQYVSTNYKTSHCGFPSYDTSSVATHQLHYQGRRIPKCGRGWLRHCAGGSGMFLRNAGALVPSCMIL
jgi:hypothetical protein